MLQNLKLLPTIEIRYTNSPGRPTSPLHLLSFALLCHLLFCAFTIGSFVQMQGRLGKVVENAAQIEQDMGEVLTNYRLISQLIVEKKAKKQPFFQDGYTAAPTETHNGKLSSLEVATPLLAKKEN